MTSQNILKERTNTLNEIRQSTLELVLVCVGGGAWLLLLLSYFAVGYPPIMALVLWFGLESICVISYTLRNSHFSTATYVLVAGLWLCNIVAVQQFESSFFPYLFSLVGIIASILTRELLGIGLATLTSIYLLIAYAHHLHHSDVFLPMLLMWFNLMTSFALQRGLYQALDIAWVHQGYAIRQMEEARDHRHELMRLTKALMEAKADLEHANSQVQHARAFAEEARRLKAHFAAAVSHELRTPINLIIGFSEVIVNSPQSYGTALPSAYWSDITTIYRNAKHLQNLINDVLDISQIEAGQMAILKEAADPGQLVREAADLVRDEIKHRGLLFKVQIPDGLPSMSLDRLRIRQVLLNVLGNAIRFTAQGAITVRVVREDPLLRICISDTGLGINPAELHRVFEEFHQIDGSLSRQYGGSGLGLTLSQQFVEMHGGRLWVESEGIPGKGSTFNLTLPIMETHSAWSIQERVTNGFVEKSKRYFVVLDDDPAITKLFERYSKQHSSIGVNSIAEALRLVDTIEPSALVVDTNSRWPEIEGDQLQSRIPIIRCPMPSGKRDMQTYGIADYLVKPVTFEMLNNALQNLKIPIRSILIIDDDPDIVRLFSRMLQSMSQLFTLRKAYNGTEGLKLMRNQRPDVVILDLLLPDIDGFTVVQQMKALPALADIPVLLASAYGASDAIRATTHGKLTVSKPLGFQPTEMVQCVEALVGALRPASEPTR